MAYVDNELFMFNDEAASATMTSPAFDLGAGGNWVHPLFIDVKLTKAMTSGKMTTVKVQSSADDAFSSDVDEIALTIPASIDQEAGPATLAQFYAPIKTGNRYIRLVISGTSPAGGKLSAYMANGVSLAL